MDAAEQRKSSYRAVLEKKLSIAERAVATNPSCIALQLERLKICQELWEPSALAKEWKKLVSHIFLSVCNSLRFFVCSQQNVTCMCNFGCLFISLMR